MNSWQFLTFISFECVWQ